MMIINKQYSSFPPAVCVFVAVGLKDDLHFDSLISRVFLFLSFPPLFFLKYDMAGGIRVNLQSISFTARVTIKVSMNI